MMVTTWVRSSSSDASVISISNRLAGKPVSVRSLMICSASRASRNWTGETLTAILRRDGQPGALGRVERDIALAQHILFVAQLGRRGEPARGRDLELRAGGEHRIGEPGEDCSGDLLRALGALTVEQDGEFIAADARAAGVLRRRLDQRLGDDLEELVAGEMAVKIVDALEMVEVEQEQNAGPLGFERRFERMEELAAVGEA